MKFLLEFVSCCGCAATTSSTAAANESVFVELGPSATSPRSEETLSLVNSSRQYRRRKCGRMGTSACSEWRPSLSSINEDHAVMIERRRRSEVERTVKRKGRLPGGSGERGFRDDNGRTPFSVVPAFVPTPFMF